MHCGYESVNGADGVYRSSKSIMPWSLSESVVVAVASGVGFVSAAGFFGALPSDKVRFEDSACKASN